MIGSNNKLQAQMSLKRFDVEHALNMYALSYFNFPARQLYDDNLMEKLGTRVKNAHIYLIGIVPIMDLVRVRHEGQTLLFDFQIKGETFVVKSPVSEGLKLIHEDEFWYLVDEKGDRFGPSDEQLMDAFILEHGLLEFKVVYVGQAYGKDGSRNAIDRLRKHETLQKIALKGVPDGYRLELLLLEIEPSTSMFTLFNPWAQDTASGPDRIRQGLDKLFGTSEHERITLYEASLIRHFRPHYNTEFKNSFPSTQLKVLAKCYEKDFTAVIAEICFEPPPFLLFSDFMPPQQEHLIKHDLHKDEERQVFFSTN